MIFELAKARNNHKKNIMLPYKKLVLYGYLQDRSSRDETKLLSARRISNHATSQRLMPLAFKHIISESDGTWQKMRPPGFS